MDTKLALAGSPLYTLTLGVLAFGETVWHDKDSDFPDSQKFDYLDNAVLINNSAQPIKLYLSPTEFYTALAYQVQPVTNRPFRTYAIRNDGIADTGAGEVILEMRRLPPSITSVQNIQP